MKELPKISGMKNEVLPEYKENYDGRSERDQRHTVANGISNLHCPKKSTL